MLKTCEQCGTRYLSEADPHAYVWRGGKWEDNCGCYFKAPLLSRLASAEAALKFYADLDRWSAPILRQGRIISMPKLQTSKDAGKLAREYFDKYKNSDKPIAENVISDNQILPEL